MSHYVYAYKDASGSVLYVGQTGDLNARHDAHVVRNAPWFGQQVARVHRTYATRDRALVAERRLIRRLCPIGNINGNPKAIEARKASAPERPRSVGARLREARLLRTMTPAELADKVGVTVSAISQWETGRYAPRQHHQVAIARALDVPWSMLFGLDAEAAA